MAEYQTTASNPPPIALTIAGSDSGGGAGIQADLKAFSALGVYGASVIIAVTAQNTRSVTAVHAIPPAVIRAQIAAVREDINVSTIKIGMLADSLTIATVAEGIRDFAGAIVLDPVIVAKSGDRLLQREAVDALNAALIPGATLLTPNLPEAAELLGVDPAEDDHVMQQQGLQLMGLGAKAALMKGGHTSGAACVDWLLQRDNAPMCFSANRIQIFWRTLYSPDSTELRRGAFTFCQS